MDKTLSLLTHKLREDPTINAEDLSTLATSFINLPYINQLIFDIGHELFQTIISNHTELNNWEEEEDLQTTPTHYFFFIYGKITLKTTKETWTHIDGPLNQLSKSPLDKGIIIDLISWVNTLMITIDIQSILDTKSQIKSRNINDWKQFDIFTRYFTKLTLERINKYIERKSVVKNETVYNEGDWAKDIYFVKRGEFMMTKKRKDETDVRSRLLQVNDELNYLSKQSEIYNWCWNGHYAWHSKDIIQKKKEWERMKFNKKVPSCLRINLYSLRENSIFGEWEPMKNNKIRITKVHCTSDGGEILRISYDNFVMISSNELIKELENGAWWKSNAINQKYFNDCDIFDAKETNTQELNVKKKQHLSPEKRLDRNHLYKNDNEDHHYFRQRIVQIKRFDLLPQVNNVGPSTGWSSCVSTKYNCNILSSFRLSKPKPGSNQKIQIQKKGCNMSQDLISVSSPISSNYNTGQQNAKIALKDNPMSLTNFKTFRRLGNMNEMNNFYSSNLNKMSSTYTSFIYSGIKQIAVKTPNEKKLIYHFKSDSLKKFISKNNPKDAQLEIMQ